MLSYYEKEEWILECRVSLHVYNIAGDEDSNDTTPSKRNNSNNIVGYLREKNEAEIEYRKQELEITIKTWWRKIWTREKRKNAKTRKWETREKINVWLVKKVFRGEALIYNL
jgi:hypothetical protein